MTFRLNILRLVVIITFVVIMLRAYNRAGKSTNNVMFQEKKQVREKSGQDFTLMRLKMLTVY